MLRTNEKSFYNKKTKKGRRGKRCSVPAFTAHSRDAARDDAVPARRQSPGRQAACLSRASSRTRLQQRRPESFPSRHRRPSPLASILPPMADQHTTFHPRDALANTTSTTLQTATAGAIIAGVQNTLRKQNVGAMGIFTRSGGIIALYGPWPLNCQPSPPD